jgi:hypothetical protein
MKVIMTVIASAGDSRDPRQSYLKVNSKPFPPFTLLKFFPLLKSKLPIEQGSSVTGSSVW